MPELTFERLSAVFTYDPTTGVFTRLIKKGSQRAGSCTAGSLGLNGYLRITIDGVGYKCHRLAWLFTHKSMPPNGMTIDHINGDRTDNRIENLRCVPQTINRQNLRSCQSNSQSGLLGVTKLKYHDSKWRARIWDSGRRVVIGTFDSPDAAYAAYLAAKRRLHPGCTI